MLFSVALAYVNFGRRAAEQVLTPGDRPPPLSHVVRPHPHCPHDTLTKIKLPGLDERTAQSLCSQHCILRASLSLCPCTRVSVCAPDGIGGVARKVWLALRVG